MAPELIDPVGVELDIAPVAVVPDLLKARRKQLYLLAHRQDRPTNISAHQYV